jgi:hypothetical protein
MMSPADYIAQLESVVREQMAEIDQLRATIGQKDAELAGLITWIAGDAGALETLQSIYIDPRASIPWKVRAASSALPFERSKPASVSVVVDFKSRVHDARMQTVELRKQEWTRQEPLDLDGPTPATILGGDHEGEALGPDPAA